MLFFKNFYFFSKPQQYKLAKYCEEIFEDYLLKKPLDFIPVRFLLFWISALNYAYYVHWQILSSVIELCYCVCDMMCMLYDPML